MFCPKCGKQLPEGSIACNFCATLIPAQYAENAPTYQGNTPNTPPAPPAPPAPKKKELWPWIALLVGLIALAVVLGINTFGDDKEEPCYQLASNFIKTYFKDDLDDIEEIRFVKDTAPDDAIDVSVKGDESALAWLDGDTLYVAAADGKTLYAPEDCSRLFWYIDDDNGNIDLKAIDFDNFDTSKTTNMYALFYNCVALESLDVADWDVSNVTDMSFMFDSCVSLESLDVSNWDVSNVTAMSCMFVGCDSLESLDVEDWDVSNVTDMSYMFYGCVYLKSLDVSNWDVSKVTDMSDMFDSCPAPKPSWYQE